MGDPLKTTGDSVESLTKLAKHINFRESDRKNVESFLSDAQKTSLGDAKVKDLKSVVKEPGNIFEALAYRLGYPKFFVKETRNQLLDGAEKIVRDDYGEGKKRLQEFYKRLGTRFGFDPELPKKIAEAKINFNDAQFQQMIKHPTKHPSTVVLPPAFNVSPLIRFARWSALGLGIVWGYLRFRRIAEYHADVRDHKYEVEVERDGIRQRAKMRAEYGGAVEIANLLDYPPVEAACVLGSNSMKKNSGV